MSENKVYPSPFEPRPSTGNLQLLDYRDQTGSNVNQALTELNVAQDKTQKAVESLVCRVTAVEQKCASRPFQDWFTLDNDHLELFGGGFVIWFIAMVIISLCALVFGVTHPNVLASSGLITGLFLIWNTGVVVLQQLTRRSR